MKMFLTKSSFIYICLFCLLFIDSVRTEQVSKHAFKNILVDQLQAAAAAAVVNSTTNELDLAILEEIIGGVGSTIFETILSKVLVIIAQAFKDIEIGNSNNLLTLSNSSFPLFPELISQFICIANRITDGFATGLTDILISRMTSTGLQPAKILIYINTYNAYSDKALLAIQTIDNVLKTNKLSPSVNATCSAYSQSAKDNLANQAKEIQTFYQSIPGEIADTLKEAFGGFFGKFQDLFDGIFNDIIGKLPIPKLPFL